jgi:hypothetical protein
LSCQNTFQITSLIQWRPIELKISHRIADLVDRLLRRPRASLAKGLGGQSIQLGTSLGTGEPKPVRKAVSWFNCFKCMNIKLAHETVPCESDMLALPMTNMYILTYVFRAGACLGGNVEEPLCTASL